MRPSSTSRARTSRRDGSSSARSATADLEATRRSRSTSPSSTVAAWLLACLVVVGASLAGQQAARRGCTRMLDSPAAAALSCGTPCVLVSSPRVRGLWVPSCVRVQSGMTKAHASPRGWRSARARSHGHHVAPRTLNGMFEHSHCSCARACVDFHFFFVT